MRSIANVFGRSPFIQLQMHMEKVSECVGLIPQIFGHYRKRNNEAVKMLAQKISNIEHEADIIKHDIRNKLSRGLFLPVGRANLLRILTVQDSIANRAENIAVLLMFKQASSYDSFDSAFDSFLGLSLEAFNMTSQIINELDELIETGFGGIKARKVLELAEKVELKEHETDVCQQELVKNFLVYEDSISYGDFFLWMRIISQVAKIADRAENLAAEICITLESN